MWNGALWGRRVLERALSHRRPDSYQLQAAVAALHVDEAETTGRRSPRSTASSSASSRLRSSR